LAVYLAVGVTIFGSPFLSAGPSECVKKKDNHHDTYEVVDSRSPSPTERNDARQVIGVIQLRTAN
jgi:hypothetical protein